MTTFQIVALYIALAFILNAELLLRVGRGRLSKGINLGDGGDEDMNLRIRAHGNFTENAPLLLLGLLAVAFMNGSPVMLHVLGIAIVGGRVLHAMGMAGTFGQGRLVGTVASLLAYIVTALYLLYLIFLHGPV